MFPARLRRPLEAGGLLACLVAAGALYWSGAGGAANYDEGVYLASLDALRSGQELGSQVFASQPPGFYLLLRLGGFLAGDGLHELRAFFLTFALGGLVAAYFIGRKLAGVAGAFAALAVCAVAPPFPSLAARIEADLPATALALVSIALLLYAAGSRERPLLAALAGAVFALAISVKLLALTALVPLVAIAVVRSLSRRSLLAALGGASAVAAAFLVAYAGVLGDLWRQVVGFHLDSRKTGPSTSDNLERVVRFLDFRTPFTWLVLAAIAGGVFLLVRRARRGLAPLWSWAVAAALLLVFQRPLLDHHLVLLALTLAVAAGTTLVLTASRLPRAPSAALALFMVVFVGAGLVQEKRRLARDELPGQPGTAATAASLRSASTPGELVASDQPIVAHEAGRVMPGRLVDTSAVRFSSGSLTRADVLSEIRSNHVRLVVVGREFRNVPGLERELRAMFGPPRRFGELALYGSNR